MKISFSKKTIFYFFVLVWIIFSVFYIVWDVWTDFKQVQIMAAYEQGRIDTINVLISEAGKCEPVYIKGTEKEEKIISVYCLTENIGL